MNAWEVVRWEGGPHDGLHQRFRGGPLSEWRTCECHGVDYRYVGTVDDVHVLVVRLPEFSTRQAITRKQAA